MLNRYKYIYNKYKTYIYEYKYMYQGVFYEIFKQCNLTLLFNSER